MHKVGRFDAATLGNDTGTFGCAAALWLVSVAATSCAMAVTGGPGGTWWKATRRHRAKNSFG